MYNPLNATDSFGDTLDMAQPNRIKSVRFLWENEKNEKNPFEGFPQESKPILNESEQWTLTKTDWSIWVRQSATYNNIYIYILL